MSRLARTFGILLVALLISAWIVPAVGVMAPEQSAGLGVTTLAAGGGNVRLIVNNRTGAVIPQLVLTGAKTYTFYDVPQGRNIFEISRGTYKIQYQACGAKKAKKVNIQGNTKFSTVTCPVVKIQILNQTNSNLYLTLTGPSTYRFTLPHGTTPIIVLKGVYKYTMQTACGTERGTVAIKRKARWTWWCN
ncbi:MAG: hypothetical protein JSV61_07010 [Anaerolineales bacterium]|nr:MAG: hypothetical protein JSV61_07010 [Anaerolineales bacterium]